MTQIPDSSNDANKKKEAISTSFLLVSILIALITTSQPHTSASPHPPRTVPSDPPETCIPDRLGS